MAPLAEEHADAPAAAAAGLAGRAAAAADDADEAPVDFSDWFDAPTAADVLLRITYPADDDAPAGAEAGPPGGGASGAATARPAAVVARELRAHRIILEKGSDWARAAMGPAWRGGGGGGGAAPAAAAAAGPAPLELAVDCAADAAAAELLLRCVYSTADAGRPLRGADEGTLLRVLCLADRLAAGRVLRAAAAALASPPGGLSLAAAAAALALPPCRGGAPGVAPLAAAAADALVAGLGDLDAALLDRESTARLQALPAPALFALLSDARTRGSEGAAVHAFAEWAAAAAPGLASAGGADCGGRGGGEDTLRGIVVGCLRVQHLGALYSATVAAPLLADALGAATARELFVAAFAAGAPEAVRARLAEMEILPLVAHAAWRLPPRPPSRVPAATLAACLPPARLRALHEAAAAPGGAGGADADAGARVAWRGVVFGLHIQASACDDGGVVFGAFVIAEPPPGFPRGCVGSVMADFSLSAGRAPPCAAAMTLAVGFGCPGRGWADAFGRRWGREWDEAAWAPHAGADGCVQVAVSIAGVV
ncbi:hypothetical protein Rsub_09117 [Raphidocelis subcapitata]|uniref:Uncharacterized protein n=1 Tax=Raphidocelis subcapitata TaxID=307507 RepID=A0A2V0P9K4_9CHLO|nr:hypothetical protein Rsub_09117 [Raphidocelis subcapitata]|eukprot:GBF96534.1 hypothetical protein Rsub_09117 [Raphidocelis subcapitata]